MGDVWAILLVFGVTAPAIVLAASAWLVFRWATALGELQPDSRAAWQWVLAHVALISLAEGAAAVVLAVLGSGIAALLPTSLAAVTIVITPIYLRRRLQRERARRPPHVAKASGAEATTAVPGAGAEQRRWGTALLFLTTGTFLPWLVGLGVKAYLDSQGRPTLPLSDFTDPRVLPVLFIQTLTLWAFPFLILASAVVVPWRVGFAKNPEGRASMLPIWLAYSGGLLGDLALFVGIFWEFDGIMLIVPLGLYVLPPMSLGYGIGWWIVRRKGRPRAGRGSGRDAAPSGPIPNPHRT